MPYLRLQTAKRTTKSTSTVESSWSVENLRPMSYGSAKQRDKTRCCRECRGMWLSISLVLRLQSFGTYLTSADGAMLSLSPLVRGAFRDRLRRTRTGQTNVLHARHSTVNRKLISTFSGSWRIQPRHKARYILAHPTYISWPTRRALRKAKQDDACLQSMPQPPAQ